MKLIIAGSRNFEVDPEFIKGAISFFGLIPTEIVCGTGRGIDTCGKLYGLFCAKIPVKDFIPDWTKHGLSAGPIRNIEMAKYADALLLIWDGESKGSKNMKEEAGKRGKIVYEVILR